MNIKQYKIRHIQIHHNYNDIGIDSGVDYSQYLNNFESIILALEENGEIGVLSKIN